jgi:hypothetical protein
MGTESKKIGDAGQAARNNNKLSIVGNLNI